MRLIRGARRSPGAARLLNFVTVIGQYVPKTRPTLLRYGDGSPEVGLYLRYAHVHAPVVLPDVEVEVLVVDVHVTALGQVGLVRVLVRAKLV